MRIVVAGILQESNTFSLAKTDMNYFRTVFLTGAELERMNGVHSELNGYYIAAARESDVEILPAFYTQAVSAGRVEADTYAFIKQALLKEIAAALPADGVLLVLHGAMVAEGCDDVEGDVIEGVRDLVGPEIPIAVTLDLHANVTKQMVRGADTIVGYQTYPHVDHTETGVKAAQLMFRMIRQSWRPSMSLLKLPMIVPAENSQTSHGPFADLVQEAQLGERCGHALHTTIFPVQPWLDIEEMGASVVVVAETPEQAASEAKRIATLFWDKRIQFEAELHSVAEVVEKARANHRSAMPDQRPMIISDSADSTGAGSTGDSNAVLMQLLQLKADRDLHCLINIVDPEAVEMAIRVGVRGTVTCPIGHKLDSRFGAPFAIEGFVKSIHDGRYTFGKGFFTNLPADMGPTVVLQIGTVSVLVMSKSSFTVDPQMYRSVGLEPKEAHLVLVKSANQFRACYGDISDQCYILDTPGCSTANLRSLNFTKLPSPYYPFDPIQHWQS